MPTESSPSSRPPLTVEDRAKILESIDALAQTLGAKAIVLTPLAQAQAYTSQIWRLSQNLRQSLIFADADESLQEIAKSVSDGSLRLLGLLEDLVTPGEKFEMEEVEALTAEDG